MSGVKRYETRRLISDEGVMVSGILNPWTVVLSEHYDRDTQAIRQEVLAQVDAHAETRKQLSALATELTEARSALLREGVERDQLRAEVEGLRRQVAHVEDQFQIMQIERDQAKALAEANYRALGDALAEAEAPRKDAGHPWVPLTAEGQIKVGDLLSFLVAGKLIRATARQVLNAGTEREEVVYNVRRNHYFITRMAVDGSSTHKRVMVAAMAQEARDEK